MNEIKKWLEEYGGIKAVDTVISGNLSMIELKDRIFKYLIWKEKLDKQIRLEMRRIQELEDNYPVAPDQSELISLFGQYQIVDQSIHNDWEELKEFLELNRFLF